MFLSDFGRLTAVRISVSISGMAYQINLPVRQLFQIFVQPCSPYILQPSFISSTRLISWGFFFFFNQTFIGALLYSSPCTWHSCIYHLICMRTCFGRIGSVWVMLFVMIHVFLYFAFISALLPSGYHHDHHSDVPTHPLLRSILRLPSGGLFIALNFLAPLQQFLLKQE